MVNEVFRVMKLTKLSMPSPQLVTTQRRPSAFARSLTDSVFPVPKCRMLYFTFSNQISYRQDQLKENQKYIIFFKLFFSKHTWCTTEIHGQSLEGFNGTNEYLESEISTCVIVK